MKQNYHIQLYGDGCIDPMEVTCEVWARMASRPILEDVEKVMYGSKSIRIGGDERVKQIVYKHMLLATRDILEDIVKIDLGEKKEV